MDPPEAVQGSSSGVWSRPKVSGCPSEVRGVDARRSNQRPRCAPWMGSSTTLTTRGMPPPPSFATQYLLQADPGSSSFLNRDLPQSPETLSAALQVPAWPCSRCKINTMLLSVAGLSVHKSTPPQTACAPRLLVQEHAGSLDKCHEHVQACRFNTGCCGQQGLLWMGCVPTTMPGCYK